MDSDIDNLLCKIRALEDELIKEIQKQQNTFDDDLHKDILCKNQERQHLQRLLNYLKKASIKNILSTPVIWAVIIPTLLLDIGVSLYQTICFPIYGIPKVKRADYLIFDRQHLNYLNIIEKINCAYCSYFNGIISYTQEIAARTEQYWCPIKHARHISTLHSRYQHFLSYGDAKSYRQNKENVRKQFDDIKNN